MSGKALVIFFLNVVHLHSQLNSLNLPPYFVVNYYTADGFNAKPRQMQPIWYNNVQIVYVGASDGVHALIDSNGDGSITSSEDHLIWNDFTAQSRSFDIEISSIAFSFDGTAFYVTLWEITKKCIPDTPYSNIHEQILTTKSMTCNSWFSSTVYSSSHGWHYTEIDPSTDKLCISFGNNGNMPSTNYPNDSPTDVPQRTISCFNDMNNPTTTNMAIRAQGIRHSVGFTFNANNNNQLWFTDHNRDNFNKANNNYDYVNFTDGELNKVSYDGEHFGFPWCHSTGTGSPYLRDYGVSSLILDSDDPWKSQVTQCKESNFTKPVQALGPHVAPNGVKFYSGYSMTNWPLKYLNSLFVAEHGSWNRPQKIGYRVVSIILDSNDDVIEHNVFVDGWMTNSNSYWGRPVDIAVLNDGSILITEDNPGSIIRIYYDGPTLSPTNNPSINPTTRMPTTDMPTTDMPTTNIPTTDTPTTNVPTTGTPTANALNTATATDQPTTMEPTTYSPSEYILVSDIKNDSKTNIYRLNVKILMLSIVYYVFYAF